MARDRAHRRPRLVGPDRAGPRAPTCRGRRPPPRSTTTGVRVDGAQVADQQRHPRPRDHGARAHRRPRPGPRSLSLVLVDKQRRRPVDASRMSRRSRRTASAAPTSAASASTARWSSATNLIGAPGHGLELVLKSLQLTRTDDHARSRSARPTTRSRSRSTSPSHRRLVRPAAGRPARGAAIARRRDRRRAAGRGASCSPVPGAVHEAPGEMALVSALVKFLAPDTVDLLFRDLTQFIGARSQLIGIGGRRRLPEGGARQPGRRASSTATRSSTST